MSKIALFRTFIFVRGFKQPSKKKEIVISEDEKFNYLQVCSTVISKRKTGFVCCLLIRVYSGKTSVGILRFSWPLPSILYQHMTRMLLLLLIRSNVNQDQLLPAPGNNMSAVVTTREVLSRKSCIYFRVCNHHVYAVAFHLVRLQPSNYLCAAAEVSGRKCKFTYSRRRG